MTNESAAPSPSASVESQHLLQMSVAGALQEIARVREDRPLAVELLARLVDLSAAHFESEELLMRLQRYPGADAHAQVHAALLSDMREAQATFRNAGEESALEIVARLHDALQDHIGGLDRDFMSWQAENVGSEARE
jgi:hemerythrin